MSIAEKLYNIQTTLKVPKDQFNDFGKYKYRSCEDILTALNKPLEKEKCILLLNDQIKHIGGYNYIEATATIKDIESDGEINAVSLAKEAVSQKGMNDAQLTGSSSSYARKYALSGLFAIDDTKDDDALNKHEDKKDIKVTTQTLLQLAKIKGLSEDKIIAKYEKETGKKVDSIQYITQEKKQEYYNNIQNIQEA